MLKWLLTILCLFVTPVSQAQCQSQRLKLQVLGSGGPELTDGRASTAYLIWLDGKATILIDAGSGSALNFEKSGAQPNDLKLVLFSHLHADHSADFIALIKAFYFTGRKVDLPVFGPQGNQLMPSLSEFINGLAGEKGIYRYLSEYVSENIDSRYKIRPTDLATGHQRPQQVFKQDGIDVSAIAVHHGQIPALAWRVDIDGCSLTFSGDMSNRYNSLEHLAQHSDILVAHHAIPEHMTGAGRALHMPPSEIGKIAAKAGVRHLILSHRMQRTLGKEPQTLRIIRKHYQGPVDFAEDMAMFLPLPAADDR